MFIADQTECGQCIKLHAGAGKGENLEGLGSSTIGPSRFWVQGNRAPGPNADTVALLPYYTYLPHRFDHPKRWTTHDCSELKQHVLTVIKVQLMNDFVLALPISQLCLTDARLTWFHISTTRHDHA